MRLDQAIALRFPGLSRRKARALLAQHRVLVNERPVSVASREVRPEDRIALLEEDREIRMLRVETDWLAVDKPSGLAVQPGRDRSVRSLQEIVAAELKREGQPHALFVVHRIDTGTTGVVIFARTPSAAAWLSALFASSEIRKVYAAVVDGAFEGERTIDSPVRDKPAVTMVRAIGPATLGTLVEAEIRTGRTHQIRIHLASIGHPVAGDRRYGSGAAAARLMMHARILEHPRLGRIESPLPPEFV